MYVAFLREIELTRRLAGEIPDMKHYYLGFYVHSCVKMRYKVILLFTTILKGECLLKIRFATFYTTFGFIHLSKKSVNY